MGTKKIRKCCGKKFRKFSLHFDYQRYKYLRNLSIELYFDRMRTYRFAFLSILLISSFLMYSCQEAIESQVAVEQGYFTLHAQNESDFHIRGEEESLTRSVLQPDGSVFWSPSDSISFFIGDGTDGGYPLVSNNTSTAAQADFIGRIGNSPQGATYYAVYPYNAKSSCTESTLYTYLPSEQTAVEGSFDDDLFISVATSQTNEMNFYHVCGGFKFSVSGEGIRKVVFRNNDGGLLAGRLTISFDESGCPVVNSITDGTDAITVSAPDGGTFIPDKYYYAILPPTRFTKGMTITYHRESEHCVFKSTKDFSVKRAVFSRVYGKDEGLTYWRTVNSYARFKRGSQILPEGIDKNTITEIHFHINSDKKTDMSPSYESRDKFMPIYFELDGTVAHFYTPADCYTAFSMNGMFSDFSSLKSLDLRSFDTSDVYVLSGMFRGCKQLSSLDISSFNTSNVTTMLLMFNGCSSLSSLDLSHFDTSNVTDMRYMFAGCSILTSLDLSHFDTSNVTDMTSMFSDCKLLSSLDLSHFDTSNVTDMTNMFCNCNRLSSLDISSFNTSNVTTMLQMFCDCSSLSSLDLSHFDTSNVTDMRSIFAGCSSLTSLDISSFNTSNVTTMLQMFSHCRGLTTLDLSHFDTSNVTDMSSMFSQCGGLSSLNISGFNTSKVTSMLQMFYDCPCLTSLDLSHFDTSSVTDMRNMFCNCKRLTSLDLSHFDTSNVTDMSNMFIDCKLLSSLDISSFNTSNVTTMLQMFCNCSSLSSLDLSHFDTSNVTDMTNMFYKCKNLTSLNITGFNTSKVETLHGMFSSTGLSTLDLRHFTTSNVTDMSFLVEDSPNLEYVNLSSFNTEKVQEMVAMFQKCKSLKRIDLSNFATPALRDISQMFYGCTGLRRLILSNFDMSLVNAKYAACYNLTGQSKSCKIICSTATKHVLEDESTYLGNTSEYIHWYLDGAMPESDDDDDEDVELYASTDYSMDGKYSVLQKATQGNGIDIVFIGDAYSDRLIADGTYDATMKRAMEEFFKEEPYKSLRNLFNVYEVYAVSKNETVDGITALSTWFGEGSHIGGNDGKALAYATQIPSVTNLDNTLINVIINRRAYAGTSYMYYSSSGDYGSGLSVTYIPLCQSDEEFGNTLRHEAGGHGFAKLADEYWYDENGEISKEERENMVAMSAYGWYKNVDFTDNLMDIKWNRFVFDSRYSSQCIAAYLGGSTYPFGVWRPTEYSIMRYNTDGYNAPSREAIYYRANKLAYGESWK